MGGTTAKAGVIYEGNVLMTGAALIGGYATGLPVQMPMIDIQEVGTGGGSIARVEVGNALRVGPESAGAAPGPVCYGLGGTEPTITDANLVLGRLGADRFLGGEMQLDLDAAKKALTEKIADAARPRSDRGGRRHPAHRHDQDGPCGALGDHRARPRRRRLRAGRLWRRRAAARLRGGARTVASARSSSRARRGISRPTACWSPTCAAISSTPGSRRSPTRRSRRWKRSSPRWSGRAAKPSAAARRSPASTVRALRRHALRRPGARRHRRAADRAVHDAGPRRHQGAVRCRAPDPLRLFGRRPKRPRSSACAAPSSARCESRRSSTSPRAARSRTPRRSAASGRSISPAPASSRRRPMTAPALKAGNRIAGPALIEEHASTTVVHPGDAGRGRCVRRSRHHGSERLTMDDAVKAKSQDRRQSGRHRNRAQRPRRRDRGDEDQPHAHGLQHDHLRGARLHRRAVRRAAATPCRSGSACRCSSAA